MSTARAAMPNAATSTAPWYRHRWPWLLMLGPAIVVAAGVWTLWVAIDSDDGLVADDYYKRGLAINRVLERVERARALGLVAIVDVASDGAASVALTGAPGVALPTVVRLSVMHPTRAGLDRTTDLVRGPRGAYVGRIEPVPAGRWRVAVETTDWRLPAAESTGELRSVRLDAGTGATASVGSRP